MSISTYIKSHAVLAGTLALVAITTAAIAAQVSSRETSNEASDGNIKRVALVNVSNFLNGTSTVAVDGIVEATSQADLKSQIGAPVSRIRVSIGDQVYAGQTLIELENADVRAQLEQAQGQYGTARVASINTIRDAYLKGDEALYTKIDQLLFNSLEANKQIYAYIGEPLIEDRIRLTRLDLTLSMKNWKAAVDSISSASTDARIAEVISISRTNLNTLSGLLQDMSSVLSQASNNASGDNLSNIASMQALISAARSSVSSANASLTSAELATPQAGVDGLEAQLAKTIISSPISGRIASLPLRVGEFAAPGQLLATVIGGGGLEIKAYASGEDLPRIKVGANAIIQGNISGVVTNVSPSISTINRKAEVSIRISDPTPSNLVIGQNIQARIQTDKPNTNWGGPSVFMLPIQNVKIAPGEAYVFTVDEDSRIVRNNVTLGTVRGDFLEVTAGLTEGMMIVSPVYELEVGQEVRTE